MPCITAYLRFVVYMMMREAYDARAWLLHDDATCGLYFSCIARSLIDENRLFAARYLACRLPRRSPLNEYLCRRLLKQPAASPLPSCPLPSIFYKGRKSIAVLRC